MIEEPVEHALDGITQIQVQPEIDVTFASVLCALLRHDPNILMIGEIRDEETAAMAFRAAAVGRLVLSTLHANSPEGALTRLKDLGVSDYAIETSLRGVMSQRLEPEVCEACGGEGCDRCGRTGVYGMRLEE